MKAIALNGSPIKNGNTHILIKQALGAIEKEGIETEIIHLAALDIKPCTACDACIKKEACAIQDDLWPVYTKMKEADAIILASPVYCSSATPELKALMDRTSYITHWNGKVFARKVGGSLAVGRRGGHNFAIAQMNFWFLFNECYIAGAPVWTIGYAEAHGDIEKDEEGLRTARNLGENIAFLVNKLKV